MRRGWAAAGAAAGAVGVVAFVATWVVAGLLRPGYSPVHQAISQLARDGTDRRGLMTAGFVAYGALVPLLGAATWRASRACAVAVAVVGLATLGVAAFPLTVAGGSGDDPHAVCAITGYVALALAPLLGARLVGRWSVVFAVVAAAALAATPAGHATGLWQRVGLTTGDVWLLLLASRLARPRGAWSCGMSAPPARSRSASSAPPRAG